MKKILALVKKDLISIYLSPLGALVLVSYFIMASYFFMNFLGNYNLALKKASAVQNLELSNINFNSFVIENYYLSLFILMIFIIPLLISKSLTDEKILNMSDILFTYPITNLEIALGKLISLFVFLFNLIIIASLMPITLGFFVKVDFLILLSAIIALSFSGLAILAVTLAITVFSRSSLASSFLAFIFLVFLFSLEMISSQINSNFVGLLNYLSPILQFKPFLRGLIKIDSLIYFSSILLVGVVFFSKGIGAIRRS